MSDDELPMHAELASAYLDGELSEEERARAAADPEVVAVAESFGALRTAIASVEAPADASRAAALSAALSEFDAQRAASQVKRPHPASIPVVLPHRRKPRTYQIFLGAAAAAVVAVVAFAAINSTNGSNDLASSGTTSAADRSSDTSLKTAAPAATEAPSLAIESAPGALPPAINGPLALRDYAESFAATAEAPVSDAGGTSAPADTTAVAAGAAGGCVAGTDEALGQITVLGIPALAIRDTSSGVVKAVAADDCRVLFSVSP